MPENQSDEEFVGDLPKVELHIHLEGSMTAELLFALREKHGIEGLPESLETLRSWYEFRDFAHFITVYRAGVTALREPSDFSLLALTVATALAAQRVRYAEVTFTPIHHLRRGIAAAKLFEGLEHGRLVAQRQTGIEIRWIADVPGDFGPDGAERTLDVVLPAHAAGELAIVGFGLSGPELDRTPFGRAFARAREAGLHSVPHAGEVAGPESIRQALDVLRAERIGHGIACLGDPDLVERLQERRVTLEVCPTSNLRTRIFDRYADHPLPAMIEAGLAVSINSDDPAMFGTTLTDEYLHCLRDLGVTRDQLKACLRTAVGATYADDGLKAGLFAELA